MSRFQIGLMILLLFALCPAGAYAEPMEFVTVGDAGNPTDDSTGSLYGSVGSVYRIGKYEVTNTEYAEFLNAVADEDPNGLYSTNMGSNARGGITRGGGPSAYTYSVKTNMGNKPVNYVSWYDSLRFANWLHNGQPTGAQDNSTTEDGAYTMITETYPGGPLITRNAGATVWLPSEDEWYKAAYYEPGASSNDYWLYATRSDGVPTVATANATGDISNPGPNVVNYNLGADWNGQNGNVTTVGSAGLGSEGYYGTADMNGNVREWNEAVIAGSVRGLRGGRWFFISNYLQASYRDGGSPTNEDISVGFRVASVPEPGSITLLVCGLLACLIWWRCRK